MAYTTFTIPNASGASFAVQSEVFSQDLQILADGLHGNGVVNGCTVTQRGAGANMSVDVAAGNIVREGATVVVAGGNAVISAAHATLNRIDLVSADNTGALVVTTGTAATLPEPATIPQVANVNNIVLAFVYVPAADTAINTNQIVDKRAMVNAPGAGTFTGGMSNLGNTSGTTGTVGSRLLIVGGANITVSQSINGQSATLSISGAAGGGGGVIGTSVNPVASASSVGTVTRYAPEDHRHAGLIQAQISGNTSNTSNAFQGSLVLAGGNNITLSQVTAAGGATITISAGAGGGVPIATAVKSVSSIGSTGTITRYAPEDHQHAGLHQISVGGNTAGATTAGAGSFMLAGGNNVTLSAATAAGGMTITVSAANETQTVPPIGTAVKAVSSAGSTGTITRFAPEDHAHAGLNTISVAGNTAGATTAGAGSLVLAGGNNITLSGATAAGGMTLSINGGAGGGGGFSAGISTGGNTAGTSGTVGSQLVLVGGTGVTLSQSVNGASATVTINQSNQALPYFFPGDVIGTTVNLSNSMSSIFLMHALVPTEMTLNKVQMLNSMFTTAMTSAAANTTYGLTFSKGVALYGYDGTQLTVIASNSVTQGFTWTSNVSSGSMAGLRLHSVPLNATLAPGNVWLAFSFSSSATRSGAVTAASTQANSFYSGGNLSQFPVVGQWSSAADGNVRGIPFQGVYSVQSAAFPGTIASGDLNTGASINLWFRLDGAISG